MEHSKEQPDSYIKSFDLFSYPSDTSSLNPYIAFLHQAIKEVAPLARIFPNAIERVAPDCFTWRPERRTVIHIHWIPELWGIIGYLRMLTHFLLISFMQKRKRATVILTIHNRDKFHWRPFWTAFFSHWARTLAQGCIFHCEAARSNSHKLTRSKKSFVIPHGNFIGYYGPTIRSSEEARALLGIPKQAVVFLLFGTLDWAKRPEWLLPALAKIKSAKAHFVLCGTILPKFAPLLAPLHRDRKFTIIPKVIPREHVRWIFGASDFLISAQRRGYVSGIAIAALSYGVPVLSLQNQCVDTLINHGQNGLLFTESSLEDAVQEAIAARNDQPRYMKMIDAALQSARERDWSRIARLTINAYVETSRKINVYGHE